MSQRALTFLLVALGVLAVVGGAALAVADRPERTASGTASVDLGRAVPQSATAVAELKDAVDGWGHDCRVQTPETDHHLYVSSLDAIGVLSCAANGTGATSLTATRFRTDRQLDAGFGDWKRFLPTAVGACDDADGTTRWAPREGPTRGQIVCGTSGDDAYIAWTDERDHTLYVVRGTDRYGLHTWWWRHVKPLGRFPSGPEQPLLRLLGEVVDTDDCGRDDSGGSPASVASIYCSRPQAPDGRALGVENLTVQRFALQENLDRHFDRMVAQFAPYASRRDDAFCDAVPSYVGPWYNGGAQRGRILCFPSAEREWVEWTLDSRRLYISFSGDDRGRSLPRLYRRWQQLADIGL